MEECDESESELLFARQKPSVSSLLGSTRRPTVLLLLWLLQIYSQFTTHTNTIEIKMRFSCAFLAMLSSVVVANGFAPIRPAAFTRGGRYVKKCAKVQTADPISTETHTLFHPFYSLPMSTTEEPKTEGKKAGDDAPPVNIGWDSHKPVVSHFVASRRKFWCRSLAPQ